MDAREAAKLGLHGPLTRSEEVWAPNDLLCTRCGVKNPFKGMYDRKKRNSKQFQSRFDQRNANFGCMLLGDMNKTKKDDDDEMDAAQSKGEIIAAMLRETEINEKQPPILELKQLKTWSNYLMEGNKQSASKKR